MYKDGPLSTLLAGQVDNQQQHEIETQIKLSDTIFKGKPPKKYISCITKTNTYMFSEKLKFKHIYSGKIVDDMIGLFTFKKN